MIEKVFALWESERVQFSPPASSLEISAFEERYAVLLPISLRTLYLKTDGLEYDHGLIRFWPISEIEPVPSILESHRGSPDYGGIAVSLPAAPTYFVFADYSIMLHSYAIQLTSEAGNLGAVVWIANGKTWRNLSPSFELFLSLYLKDYESVEVPREFRRR